MAEGSQRVRDALAEQQARLGSLAARLKAARSVDVHDARVAARRLRSLLATYRPLIDERRARRLRRRLRDFARALSGVREADVRYGMLVALAMQEPGLAAADTRRLRVALRQSIVESRRLLRRELASKHWASSVSQLADGRTLTALDLRPDAGPGEVLELVDRPWRDAARLIARPPKGAAGLHRLRLVLKRCRYALESVASVQPRRAERVLACLRSAQDSLGEHRDAALAREWVRASEDRLGRSLARRPDPVLRRHQNTLKGKAVERAARALPAYADWRQATREVRRSRRATRGRA